MRFIFSITTICLFYFSTLFATENQIERIHLSFPAECLVITDDGIFIRVPVVEEMERRDIVLENLHFDEKGYYTLCDIAFVCTACDTILDPLSDTCTKCGVEQISLKNLKNEKTPISVEAFLTAILKESPFWQEGMFLCDSSSTNVVVGAKSDKQGNQEVDLTFSQVWETTDNETSIEFKTSLEVSPDGNVSGRAEIGWKFKK